MKMTAGQPFPLGVSVSENNVNFSVAVPEGKSAALLLYKESGQEPVESIELNHCVGEVRTVALTDLDASLQCYNYQFDDEIVVDPYVKSLAGKSIWCEKKDAQKYEICGKIFTDEYNWEGDKPLRLPYEEVIAYSLHVRGFSMDKASGVRANGTFEGIIEKIPYLTELGINQIHCMPVYEFEECTEPVNYWGYGEGYYFAPKNAYSAIGDGVKSLKDMVKKLHKAGIEVVLEMPFSENIPKQLITDCLRHYVMEYHIDGFVCNPYVAEMSVLRTDPYLKYTKIMKHQTEFKDSMRQFLKGDGGQTVNAVFRLRTLSKNEGIFNYIASHSGFTMNDLVSYNEKHNVLNGENNRDGSDDNNSWNCGTEGPTQYDEIVALRKNQMRNAWILLLLSQGTPCLLAGDEWCNTQLGNNNVYCQDNELGWLNWERFPYYHEMFEFVKDLIAFRKQYEVFHPAAEYTGRDMKNCGIPDVSYHGSEAWKADFSWESRRLGVFYHDEMADEHIFIAYNMYWEIGMFALPKLPSHKEWHQIVSTEEGVIKDAVKLSDQQRQSLMGRSIAVYIGKKYDET